MKIQKIIDTKRELENGIYRFAILSNKTVSTKKCQKVLSEIPHWQAVCRSHVTHNNTVIFEKDARLFDVKVAAYTCHEIAR